MLEKYIKTLPYPAEVNMDGGIISKNVITKINYIGIFDKIR